MSKNAWLSFNVSVIEIASIEWIEGNLVMNIAEPEVE